MAVQYSDTLGTKDYNTIVDDTLQAIVDKDIGITNVGDGSVVRSLVEALAENDDEINYWLEFIYGAMNIDTLVSEEEGQINTELDRAAVIFGLTRNPAKSAVGSVTVYTGDSPAEYDISIPYGYIFSTRPDADGNTTEWQVTDTNATIPAGEHSVDVTVACTTEGSISVVAGAICILPTALQGIDSVSNKNSISGGSDIESDTEFLERIHSIKESMGQCTDDAIEQAVNAVSGVTRAIVRDRYQGIGTTGIIVTTDQVPAPQSVVDNINSVVSKVKASGIYPIIVYTNYKIVDMNFTISPSSDVDADKIITAINDYCNALGTGNTLIVSQLQRKILNALDNTSSNDDLTDIKVNAPTANVTTTEDQMIQAGNIIVNGIKIN